MKKGKFKTVVIIISVNILILTLLSGCNNKKSEEIYVPKYEIKYNTSADDCDMHYEIISGSIYASGTDSLGLFGESFTEYSEPIEIVKANNIIHIEALSGAVMYLTSNGEVYSFGYDESGYIIPDTKTEDGLFEITRKPQLIMKDCSYASLGANFMLLLKNDNTLWFVGKSTHGQSTDIEELIKEPVLIKYNVKFARAMQYTTAWIDNDNKLYLCGDNSYGQIGNGETGCGFPTKFKDIVKAPYLALENCAEFNYESVSNGTCNEIVVYATSLSGEKYAWGGEYGPTPDLIK